MEQTEKLLTLQEAEALTGRRVSTWRRDIWLKRITYVKLGRQIRIPLSEINRLIKSGWREAVQG